MDADNLGKLIIIVEQLADITQQIADGTIGAGLVIDPNHIFAGNTARDTYFTAHPAEKIVNTFISVGTVFQQWDGSTWMDKTAVVKGPKGDTGAAGANGTNGVKGDTGAAGAQGQAGYTPVKGVDYFDGEDGVSTFVYIAYASDANGTGFTTVYNSSLDYIAILSTNTAIVTPHASDFVGLWKKISTVAGGQYLNVKDYGAIGNGSSHPLSRYFATLAAAQAVYPAAGALTDELDWAAIQKLLDLCKLSFRTTYIPAGTYVINKPIVMPGWCNLYGEGQYCTIIKNIAATAGIRVTGDRSSLKDFKVIGNATGTYGVNGTTGDGILMDGSQYDGCSYVNIDSVYCYRNGGNGIRFYGGNWIHSLKRCTFSDNLLAGIKIDRTDGYAANTGQKNMIDINTCTVSGNGRNGMLIAALSTNITGCTIENNHGKGISMDSHDLDLWNGTDLTQSAAAIAVNIIGNYFEGGTQGCIYMRGGSYTGSKSMSFYGVKIEGNYFYDWVSSMDSGYNSIIYGAMENSGAIINLRCVDNYITDFSLFGGYALNFTDCLDATSEVNLSCMTLTNYCIGLEKAHNPQRAYSQTVQGYFYAKGVTYTNMDKSDNITGTTTVRFPVPLSSGFKLRDIKIPVYTDSTNYEFDVRIKARAAGVTDAYVSADTLLGHIYVGNASGSKVFSGFGNASIGTRIPDKYCDFYLEISISFATHGTYFNLGNPTIGYYI